MFSVTKLSAAVMLAASLAHATITITSAELKANGENTIKWTSTDATTDPPSFSIELSNPKFNHLFAVGTNIPTSLGTYTFQMPAVEPGPNYAVQFVGISDVNNVLAQSPGFAISAGSGSSAVETSGTAAASAAGTGTLSSGATNPTNAAGGTPTQSAGVAGTGITSGNGTNAGNGTGIATGVIGATLSNAFHTTTSAAAAATSGRKNGAETAHVPMALLAVGFFAGLI